MLYTISKLAMVDACIQHLTSNSTSSISKKEQPLSDFEKLKVNNI